MLWAWSSQAPAHQTVAFSVLKIRLRSLFVGGREDGGRRHLRPPESSPLVVGVWLLLSHCNLSSPLGAHPGLGSYKGRGADQTCPQGISD